MYNSQPGVGIRLGPESKSQKAASICDMSFAQYVALKKGPLPLCLFTLHQIWAPIFYTHKNLTCREQF